MFCKGTLLRLEQEASKPRGLPLNEIASRSPGDPGTGAPSFLGVGAARLPGGARYLLPSLYSQSLARKVLLRKSRYCAFLPSFAHGGHAAFRGRPADL